MTPHATTKIALCALLYNRTVNGHLPELPSKKVLNKHKEAKENIEKTKERNKESYDKRHHANESDIKEGDILFVYRRNEIS